MSGCAAQAVRVVAEPEQSRFLESIRRGEREAIERVYREHRGDVERTVRNGLRRAGRLTAANVGDVVQDVFVRAFSERARARYDAARAFAPFLQRIAGNVVIDWLRHSRRQVQSDVELDVLDCHEEGDSTSCSVFPQELREVACGYIGALEPGLRGVFELRFVAGAGQLDAARSLGISRQQLRTLERRLVDGLREALWDAGTSPRPPVT